MTNYADLQATSSGGSGGIAGRFSDVNSSNLTNYGNLTFSGSGRGYGGIVGDHDDSSAHDCYNYGNVEFTSTGSYGSVGGIMGYQDGQNYLYNIGNASSFIKVNRFSTGSLYGSNMRIGGVIGGIDYGNSVNNVYNYADIIYNSEGDGDTSNVSINIGGLFGHKNTSYDTNINGYNTGNITVISNNPKEKILVSGIEADGTGYNMSKTYFIGDISVTSINSESEVCGFSNQMYLGNNNYSTFYYKGSILSNTNTYGFSKKFESNVDNVYLDLITNEQTPFLYNIFDVSSSRSGKGFTNAYYRIVGNSNYTKNEGSVEYNFDNVDGLWFRDTLNLGDSWKYEEGYYPLMYKSDINKNPTTELLDGQIKKAIE